MIYIEAMRDKVIAKLILNVELFKKLRPIKFHDGCR